MKTLDKALPLKSFKIQEITDPVVYENLASLGFDIGANLNVISRLPFNGAIACECNNARFAIRAEDAASIIISD
ncbi:MAG: FeoA family protein [Candidatus Margulisiibacteriota bacterium]